MMSIGVRLREGRQSRPSGLTINAPTTPGPVDLDDRLGARLAGFEILEALDGGAAPRGGRSEINHDDWVLPSRVMNDETSRTGAADVAAPWRDGRPA